MTPTKLASTAVFSIAAVLALAGAHPEPGPPALADEPAFDDFPAFVVKTVPEAGATEVDPALAEIRVTFSKEMTDKSWSWVQYSGPSFPQLAGDPRYEAGGKTCVLPVKLEPGKVYAILVNSPRFGNFKDSTGKPAVPFFLAFRTKPPI